MMIIKEEDVIKFRCSHGQKPIFVKESTYKVEDLAECIVQRIRETSGKCGNNVDYMGQDFYDKGLPAEYLDINSENWIKGKITMKVIFEFTPEENSNQKDNT
jgi:hypothetical protein